MLEDFDACATGIDMARSLDPLRPEIVRIDFGDSSLRRCILALPVVDALIARFRGARVQIRARRAAAALLRAHVTANESSSLRARCDPGEMLTVDLGPGQGHAQLTATGAHTRLRIRSAPFPWKEQSPAEHWVDAAWCAGLWPIRALPKLRISKQAGDAARKLARAKFGLWSGPIVALLPSIRARIAWGTDRQVA